MKKHLKRKPAPKHWPLHRKELVWTVKPKTGPHSLSSCFPLSLVVREVLGYAKTRLEAKRIIAQRKLMVDGKVRSEALFPTGLMDVISIPEVEQSYRVLPSYSGLVLHPIQKEEASFKLCRIEDKTIVKKGQVQLNLHDGSNLMVKIADPEKPVEETYNSFDTLKLTLPEREVSGHFPMKMKASVLIFGGKNLGKTGVIVDVEKIPDRKRRALQAVVEDQSGNRFQTILDYLFVLGDAKPEISLPEAR